MAEGAVSPVISTILMVAVTVVLAATAFVLVADIGGDTTKPSLQLGITHDDVADTLVITQAETGANWKRVSLAARYDGSGIVRLGNTAGVVNEPASTSGLQIQTGTTNLLDTDLDLAGGDTLYFCREGGTDGSLKVQLVDEDTNGVIGAQYEFGALGECPP